MWYKYIDRASYDAFRVWRRANLKFNQDDNGLLKDKNPGFLSEHLYRAARSEGPLRGALAFIFVSSFTSYLWYSGQKQKQNKTITDQKLRIQNEKNDKRARDSLWYNRFNVPSRPLRSVDDFMIFIASQATLDRAFQYIGYPGTVSVYEDYQAGLDGIASQEDKKMLDYYKESLKHKSHH